MNCFPGGSGLVAANHRTQPWKILSRRLPGIKSDDNDALEPGRTAFVDDFAFVDPIRYELFAKNADFLSDRFANVV